MIFGTLTWANSVTYLKKKINKGFFIFAQWALNVIYKNIICLSSITIVMKGEHTSVKHSSITVNYTWIQYTYSTTLNGFIFSTMYCFVVSSQSWKEVTGRSSPPTSLSCTASKDCLNTCLTRSSGTRPPPGTFTSFPSLGLQVFRC